MKLGIVVVYLVREEDEKLLDLHLRQIEEHTQVPYTIYCSVNRLLPKFRSKLEQHPKIRICDCPTTGLRDAPEHSFYLEHLVGCAIADGVSHVVTLHVDSFPLRSGWAETLDGKLSDTTVFATTGYGPYTACLFFRRDWYLNHHPRFLLTEAERASSEYKLFSQSVRHMVHSGAGYLFKAYTKGLAWYSLTQSNEDTTLGTVYDDLIFHLYGLVRNASEPFNRNSLLGQPGYVLLLNRVRALSRKIIPNSIKRYLWRRHGRTLGRTLDRPAFEYAKDQLKEDPESYLRSLRTGKR